MENIETATATGSLKQSFDDVEKRLGRVPNMFRVMANAPNVLDAYLRFSGALGNPQIGVKFSEQIALATAEVNSCTYCLSAHSYFAQKAGLSDQEILEARTFSSTDHKTAEGLRFVEKMLRRHSELSPSDTQDLLKAGYSEGEVLEIIAFVVRNIFTNYLNIVAQTAVDWKEIVEPLNAGTHEH